MKGLVALIAIAGCDYSPKPGTLTELPDAPPDTPPGPCETLGDTCGNATTIFSCTTLDVPPTQIDCPWGCIDDPVHCGTLQPSGGGATSGDLDATSLGELGEVTLANGATINGDGAITNASSANFDHALRGPNQSIAVFRFKKLTIEGDVKLLGSKAIVLVSDEPISIGGVIDALGPCGVDNSAALAGPGGFAGGTTAGAAGLGPGGGGGTGSTVGGGGGANGGKGGKGGNAGATTNGGIPFTTPDTIPVLFGGQGGGAGGGGGGFGRGGGGGGAIQLISNTAIIFLAGSGINAGGCGGDGDSGGGADGGGGGGAGGTILLEAPVISGPGALAVNGGGGGSGGEGPGDTGEQGKLSRTASLGQPGGDGDGGNGASGADLGGSAGEDDSNDGGGGGGGIGRIRFHTRTGDVAVTGVMSPALDDDPTTATAGRATVE